MQTGASDYAPLKPKLPVILTLALAISFGVTLAANAENVALSAAGAVAISDSDYSTFQASAVNDGKWIGPGDKPDANRWHGALGKPHPHWVWIRFRQPARIREDRRAEPVLPRQPPLARLAHQQAKLSDKRLEFGTVREQLHRRVGQGVRGTGSAGRQGQRRERGQALAVDAERLAAGRQHGDAGTPGQEGAGTSGQERAGTSGQERAGAGVYKVGLNTSRLLMALGDVVCAWLLLRGADVALAALAGEVSEKDKRFYEGKVAAAQFFAQTVLPKLSAERAIAESTDLALMDLSEASF